MDKLNKINTPEHFLNKNKRFKKNSKKYLTK